MVHWGQYGPCQVASIPQANTRRQVSFLGTEILETVCSRQGLSSLIKYNYLYIYLYINT